MNSEQHTHHIDITATISHSIAKTMEKALIYRKTNNVSKALLKSPDLGIKFLALSFVYAQTLPIQVLLEAIEGTVNWAKHKSR